MEHIDLEAEEEFSREHPVTKLVYDSDVARVVLFCLNAGQEVPVHVSTSEVLMHVLKGRGSLIAGEEVEAGPGTVVACARNEPHGMRAQQRMVVLATIAPRP